jgi:pimeloyl-ACP methyl ester carboxylesterase
MTYQAMATDLLAFLKTIQFQHTHHPGLPSAKTYPGIKQPMTLVGHSLGGKTAMALALHPDLPEGLIGHLVVEDVSPKRTKLSGDFQAYVKGMRAVLERKSGSRKEADSHLTEKLTDLKAKEPTIDTVRAFMQGFRTCSKVQKLKNKIKYIIDQNSYLTVYGDSTVSAH